MDDEQLLHSIEQLVEEERRLREAAATSELGHADTRRLQDVEVRLDQCWDLLRQRRGKRHAGADPDTAAVRDPDTVEHYQQ